MRSLYRSFVLAVVLLPLCIYGGEIRYPVSQIDSALRKDATAIIREKEVTLEIRSLDAEVIRVHYVLTILKAGAEKEAWLQIPYDEHSVVRNLKGSLYDASGVVIRDFGSKDVLDVSAIDDGVLYSSDRMKEIRPVFVSYPVTVEYSYEVTCRHLLAYPAFRVQNAYDLSVETASLEIRAKEGLFPRILEEHLPAGTRITGDGITQKRWDFNGLLPIPEEDLAPDLDELSPLIRVSASWYKIDELSGDCSTWQSYGRLFYSLYEGRDLLTPEQLSRVRSLVKDCIDDREKIKTLYGFLQKNTRYVCVSLGIGGFQPEKAEVVARLGYGDCKGLVEYMSAMLRAVGISSFPALVNAGNNAGKIAEDFPGNQFNHVILCVPIQHDTIWLECTSQTIPFGFLGDFTENRAVLLLSPEGGKLVHTPAYQLTDNRMIQAGELLIDSAGTARVTLKTTSEGLIYDLYESVLFLSPEKQREEQTKRFTVPGLSVNSYSCRTSGDELPLLTESSVMRVDRFASRNGNRIFIPLTTFILHPAGYSKTGNRAFPMVIRMEYSVTDTLSIRIPAGFQVEGKQQSFDLQTPFGSLHTKTEESEGTVRFIRQFERFSGLFPPEDYNRYVDFIRQVNKQDGKKLVLVKVQK